MFFTGGENSLTLTLLIEDGSCSLSILIGGQRTRAGYRDLDRRRAHMENSKYTARTERGLSYCRGRYAREKRNSVFQETLPS